LYVPVILALGRLRQEEFQGSLGYVASSRPVSATKTDVSNKQKTQTTQNDRIWAPLLINCIALI
jgi:hypothetical protein